MQQILLIILIIAFSLFSISDYKLKKIQQKNFSSLNIFISSLKDESHSLKSQVTKLKLSSKKETKLPLLFNNKYSFEKHHYSTTKNKHSKRYKNRLYSRNIKYDRFR